MAEETIKAGDKVLVEGTVLVVDQSRNVYVSFDPKSDKEDWFVPEIVHFASDLLRPADKSAEPAKSTFTLTCGCRIEHCQQHTEEMVKEMIRESQPQVLYISAASGQSYDDPHAAGDIAAIVIGKRTYKIVTD
jgi:hypothetical protein